MCESWMVNGAKIIEGNAMERWWNVETARADRGRV